MIAPRHLVRIDRLFKIPYYLVWEVYIGLRGLFPLKERSQNVVVLKLLGMGSIIKLASLYQKFQVDKSRVTICTFEQNRALCDLLGLDNRIFIRTNNLTVFFLDNIKAFLKVQKIKPRYIIDLERCSNAVGLLRAFLGVAGGSKTISFIKNRHDRLFRHDKMLSMWSCTHEQLLVKTIDLLPKKEMGSELRHVNVQPTKILFNINASDYVIARRYSRDYCGELIESLHQWNPHLVFYLTGSESEQNYVDVLARKWANGDIAVHNMAGKWNLDQLTNHLADCLFFITNDSGPMHLAAYMGVPTIAIWGPTHYRHFGYEKYTNVFNISLELPCSPCFTDPTSKAAAFCQGKINCMSELSPAIIEEKIKHFVNQLPSSRKILFPDGITIELKEPEMAQKVKYG